LLVSVSKNVLSAGKSDFLISLTNVEYQAMPSITRCVYVVLTFLLLLGCKVDSEYEVYVTDLVLVVDQNEVLTAPGIVRIETTGCEENKAKIMNIVSKYYAIKNDPRCINIGMDDFLEFDTQSPVVLVGENLPGNIPTGLAVSKDETTNVINLFAVLEKGRFAGMEAEVKKMDATASLDINDVTIILNNDSHKNAHVVTPSAWINNKASIKGEAKISRREKVKIKLSNVFSEVLVDQGIAHAAAIQMD
jgi:hypothetical protein